MRTPLAASILFTALSVQADVSVYEKQYDGFTIWLDCERHGALAFKYELKEDNGQIKRKSHRFHIDSDVPEHCQPTATKTFSNDSVEKERTGTYDRGHLVPANHMDNNKISYTDTFNMTNILPQQKRFNRRGGAWGYTELISECFRDISPLTIWGGVIWGNDKSDDFFVDSHGVETPDHWWKVIKRHDNNEHIAWLFPNTKEATKKDIDKYIVSMDELLPLIKHKPDFDILPENYSKKAELSWKVKGAVQLKCEGITTSSG